MGERREVGGSMKGVPAAEDASLPWGSGSGNKEEKKDLEVKKKRLKCIAQILCISPRKQFQVLSILICNNSSSQNLV